MPSNDFSAKQFIQNVIQKWWILFLAMLIGGLLGAGLSFLKAPRYEAEAKVSTSVDYTISPELEDYEEDRIINEAGWLMFSDPVLEKAHAQAVEQGIAIPYQDVLKAFTAERIDDLWTLRVVSANPTEAADLANIWVDAAYAQLGTAFEHAQTASVISTYIYSLETCLSADSDAAEQQTICTIDNIDALNKELNTQTDLLNMELELSRGLNPAARYTINSYAQIPTMPSYQARGVMSFLGIILGFSAGLVILWFTGKRK